MAKAPTGPAVGDIVLVKNEDLTYRATIEAVIVEGEKYKVRPLPDPRVTNKARAVFRKAIVGTEAKPVAVPELAFDDDREDLRNLLNRMMSLKTPIPENFREGWMRACKYVKEYMEKQDAMRGSKGE